MNAIIDQQRQTFPRYSHLDLIDTSRASHIDILEAAMLDIQECYERGLNRISQELSDSALPRAIERAFDDIKREMARELSSVIAPWLRRCLVYFVVALVLIAFFHLSIRPIS